MIEMPEHIIPSKIYKASPSEKEILEIFQYNKPINKYPPPSSVLLLSITPMNNN